MSRSGRPRTSHRLLAEDCTSIHPPNYISWPRNREGPIHVDLVATWPDGSNLTIPVDLTSTKTPSGGLRAWFLCPNCSRRCGKLFVVDENDREFRCRLCLDLAYRVQYRNRCGIGCSDLSESGWRKNNVGSKPKPRSERRVS